MAKWQEAPLIEASTPAWASAPAVEIVPDLSEPSFDPSLRPSREIETSLGAEFAEPSPDPFLSPQERIERSLRPEHAERIRAETGQSTDIIMQDFASIDLTPEAWGVTTEAEALAIVRAKATLEGKRTIGEEITSDFLVDALAILPFSPLHDWEKRGYASAKRELIVRNPIVQSVFGPEEFTAEAMDLAVAKTQARVRSGVATTTNEELYSIIRDYELEQARGLTIPAAVAKGAAVLPGYIGEFAVGGGLMRTLGLAATLPAKAPAVVKVAKAVGNALTRAGLTTAIQPHRVASALVDQELRGEAGMAAVAKAFGSVYIENLTELTGAGFNVVGTAIIKQLPMGAKVFARIQREAARLGIDEGTFLGRVAQKGGWNGLLAEIGEERLNTILYGVFAIDDFGSGPDSTIRERVAAGLQQDLKAQNMLVETLVLLTPGGVKIVAKQAGRFFPGNPELEQAIKTLETAVAQDQAEQIAENVAKEGAGEGKTPKEAAATVVPSEGPAALAAGLETVQEPGEETPQEAEVAEAQLTVEGAEKVAPNLAIGNVTARMKGVMSEALTAAIGKEVTPEEIGPFTEKGWPTKRTKIELTRAQAEEYLDWLETDLQRRLDGNLINTYDEMAQANADWGDLKALRKVLGITEKMTAEIKEAKARAVELRRAIKKERKAQDLRATDQRAAQISDREKQLAQQEEIVGSAQRPWRIVYAQKQGQVVRDQGEIEAAQKEIERLRGEFDRAKTEMDADEILAQIEAKQLEIHKLHQAMGKSAKIIKTTEESIAGAVQPSRLQESKMTVQEVLRAVMKRSAREAKMSYAAGRRELRMAMRAKANAKKRLAASVKTITRPIPATVDLVERQAIEAIRAELDPSLRTGAAKKVQGVSELLNDWLRTRPERAAEIPSETLRRMAGKSRGEYTVGDLETVAEAIKSLRFAGGLERKMEEKAYEQGKRRDLEALQAASVPLTDREMLRPEKIGGGLTFVEKANNALSQKMNQAAHTYRAVVRGMDVFFDLLDGGMNYQGVNYRVFKEGFDRVHNRYLQLRESIQAEVHDLAVQLGLREGNFERIGVHAALQQEGGRQKLLDTGYTDAQIDEVKLTADELAWYDLAREKLNELSPAIADVMEVVYNSPFKEVKEYFPYMTDFQAMSDSEMRGRFGDKVIELSARLKKNVEKGFTQTRTLGTQKIKINAMEVFLNHTDNAAYLIETAATIKRLGEIAATEEYRNAAGDVGQEEVRQWIDQLARKGGLERNKRLPWLDTMRKHIGAAMIGFRAASALVNITPLADGAGLIGNYAWRGANDIGTDGEWRKFVWDRFPELRHRMGGEREFREFGDTAIEKIEKAGFWPLRQIDGLAAASVVAGSYRKYMDEHKLTIDFENPNEEGVLFAQLMMRRSQSSGFYKDLPSGLVRGGLTGNVSLDMLLTQFQSFILNRWSYIEHDLWRMGIKEANLGRAVNMFFWLSVAGFAEMGLRRATKELVALLTGEDLPEWEETFTKEIVTNILQNVPFVSQAVSVHEYGQIPVPSLSLMESLFEQYRTLQRTKDPDKQKLHAIELIIKAGGVAAGLPGTMQVADIIKSLRRQQQEKKPYSRRGP